jgi:hypothetical protein
MLDPCVQAWLPVATDDASELRNAWPIVVPIQGDRPATVAFIGDENAPFEIFTSEKMAPSRGFAVKNGTVGAVCVLP